MKKIEIELPENYTIRFAKYEDIPQIMEYFRKYWKEDHIFAVNREYFEYEFCRYGEVNMVLLLDADAQIKGSLGFIPYAMDDRDIFTVMWKVLSDDGLFMGIRLLYYLIEHGRCRHIYTSGLNKGTVSIYRYLGFKVEEMTHFYIVNSQMEQTVAQILKRQKTRAKVSPCEEWKKCSKEDFLKWYIEDNNKQTIYKSAEYIIHRYFENPVYQYQIYYQEHVKNNFVVIRIQRYHSAKVLRVIDYLGTEFPEKEVADLLNYLLIQLNCEYADMYAWGLNKEALLKAGFNRITKNSEDIVPNHFSPFELKNIQILIMHEKEINSYIFKGDGDQDRAS